MRPRFVARMAWRETRADGRRLLLFTSAVAVGVAALVAINSFTDNLQAAVRGEARALLGADLRLESRRPFTDGGRALLDSLAAGGRRADVTTFAGMAYVTRTTGVRLVQVTAVEPGYPFYGRINTEPAGRWEVLHDGAHALVDPSLLTALGAQAGDTLALGEARFTILGAVTNAPGDVGFRSAFGPRVFIPATRVEATALLRTGSRAEYQSFITVAPGADADRVVEGLRGRLRDERIRARTVADDQERLTSLLDRLGRYLGLVALVALLLGGLGVASAVVAFVRQKIDTVAVLRCLGATGADVFGIYLLQAALLGLAGSGLGVAAGVALQQLLPALLRGALPVDVQTSLSWPAITLGLGIGGATAVMAALVPLLPVRLVSPLQALRRDVDERPAPRDPLRLPVALLVVGGVVALAGVQVQSWRSGVVFTAGIGGAVLVLWLASLGLTRAVRRWVPRRWPYPWRQGLANLYRPANQTVTVVLSLGFGAFVLATLFLVQHNLLRQLAFDRGPDRPNLVLFDIQPDQAGPLAGLLGEAAGAGGLAYPLTPIVPMRLLAVGGRPVAQLVKGDSAGAGVTGGEGFGVPALRREYRSTYRDTLVDSEVVTAGRFWGEGRAAGPLVPQRGTPDDPVEVSVDRFLAQEIGVVVGDELVWDVQGTPVVSRVTSLREVDWARFAPNFFVVFHPGALEQAPQSFVTLTRAADASALGALQRRLAERFPNVTTLDLSLVQRQLEQLIDRVTLAIRFMALFCLATGAVVLVASVRTSRFARLREGALLKTLGATRRQVLRVAFAEYLSLGLLATAVAVGLAGAAGWAIARWVFEQGFSVPVGAVTALALGVAGGTVLVGLANSLEVVRKTPLAVLRGD